MKQSGKQRKIGIRTRVFLEVGAIIAFCLLSLTVVNSQLLETVYLWSAERSVRQMAENAEEAGNDYYPLLSSYEQKDNVSIDLYDETDALLYEGSFSFISGTKLNIISRKEYEDGSYRNILQEDGSPTQYILYGKDFQNGRHIEITAQKDPIQENALLATKVTTVISVAALVLSLLFISAYAKRFTKPLIAMRDVTTHIAELDFSEKCAVTRKDEIGALAENINRLSDSLNAALSELQEKNARLEQDIAYERSLEKMRQEFISSASHELKTPIAIVRGYAEGLLMNVKEPDAVTAEYCNIIIRESDRMNELVLSLLEISMYSSGVMPVSKTAFRLDELVRDFLTKARPLFLEKGITVTLEETPDATVFADEKKLRTVLSNYISNACSHASGEKKITVSIRDSGSVYRVGVFNTGSTVEDKDGDKIFTSFYRADKAHSRAEGRFGLGLSIVKSIMELHGTGYGYENRENGVEFWFEVKKAEDNEPAPADTAKAGTAPEAP